ARRAPAVRPYMYLPVEDDRGVFPGGRMSWINQSLGLPGTTALLNSAMLTLALVLALGKSALVPAPIAFVVSLVLHIAYIGGARASWARDIAAIHKARGISGVSGDDSAI